MSATVKSFVGFWNRSSVRLETIGSDPNPLVELDMRLVKS
jgi:hypothetical protein